MSDLRDLTPEFWQQISTKLPARPTILDLGSHHLEEAELLVPHLKQAVWHGFEPNVDCFRYARDTIAPHLVDTYDCTISMTCAAVGREVGTATLYLSSKKNGEPWTPSSSIRKPAGALRGFPWMAFDKTVEVPVTTLDCYCASQDIANVDLIKMDIQGAEIDAIMGGQVTLTKTKYLITEVVGYEEYEGQASFAQLFSALPGRWALAERLVSDALFVNLDNASW
jgi:FkbM family methyltransferase